MLNKQWNYYLNFGFVSGGNMTFDEIYPYLLKGHTIKRHCYHKGMESYWYFKINNGVVQYKLPYVTNWDDYYFERIDYKADNWEIVSDEELEQMNNLGLIYEFM